MRRLFPLLILSTASGSSIVGCAGPSRGFLAEFRGRTQVRYDLEDSGKAPPASPSGGEYSSLLFFPLLLVERSPESTSTELLWPFFECGGSKVPLPLNEPPGAPLPGRPSDASLLPSTYLRARPILYLDSLRGYSRTVVFPVYCRIREKLEAGDRAIDHFWPLYGRHREWIDLAPSTTHHFFYPLFYVRNGWRSWKISLLPFLAASDGYYDRGWWLIPFIKWGKKGQSRFFCLLEPIFAYERESIDEAPSETQSTPTFAQRGAERRRERWRILGGLLGWEDERGESRLRLFWFFTL